MSWYVKALHPQAQQPPSIPHSRTTQHSRSQHSRPCVLCSLIIHFLLQEHAKQVLEHRNSSILKNATDTFYSGYLSLRSCPFTDFMRDKRWQWALSISSASEDKLLRALGLSRTERNQIEGLASMSERGGPGLTEEQLAMAAVGRLAANPPAGVGKIQRLSSRRLLRPYPLG
jgi:hypothetical protein